MAVSRVEGLRWLSRGASGNVYQVGTSAIAVKYRTGDHERFEQENRILDILEKYPYCPYLCQSFLRFPAAIFLEFIPGETLEQRLRLRQTIDEATGKVISVIHREPEAQVFQWLFDLTQGASWLEAHGLAHGDIRPPNIMLHTEGLLKLIDFDNAENVGARLDYGHVPYARLLGEEDEGRRGTFGRIGHKSEQFAIGSVLYFMSRGFEPYEDTLERADGPLVVDLLQAKQFPITGDSEVDAIIRRCWLGDFGSVYELSLASADLLPNVKHASKRNVSLVEPGLTAQ